MRIFIISQNYYPDNFRINDLSATLVKRGHDVRVLTGLPDYATSRVPEEYKGFKNRRQNIGGVEVVRVPVIARRSGMFFRCLNYLSFALAACVYCLFMLWEFDVIYVYGTSPVTSLCPAVLLKRMRRKNIFYYCLDLWPESMKIGGVSDESFLYRMVAVFSRWLYSQCDHIAVTSRPFMDYMERINGVFPDRMDYLPQDAEESCLASNFTAVDNGVADFVFMGNIGKVQDVVCIIEAAERLRETPGIRVHLVGGGSDVENCKRLVRKKGLEKRVLFYGRRPPEEMEKYYRLADACLLTLRCDTAVGFTLPGKLQGYMAAGKPVIAAIDGAASEIIAEAGCGLCARAGDAAGLAEMMRRFAKSPENYRLCGERGRKYFKEHFEKERHITQLETRLYELI
ncbi:glycosyltransferase family 4 protein [Eubacterium sp. 1001713B170207_170306_E7]|uniref:glycosyltransferase family 4 protein n=1 Tax=Eubacterium sp. 1001713B170207_170306_E7 TaxID=2787097 RepID=UPI001898BF1E|nr:glycosyltransferase family 4 protein [Eubacterium sp. 1001713B170207_170306_E7]